MINNFCLNQHNCPKLQKKDRKLIKNERKKVPLAERNEFVRDMEDKFYFTTQEQELLLKLYKQLKKLSGDTLHKDDCYKIKKHLFQFVSEGNMPRHVFGRNPIIKDMQTSLIVMDEMGMRRASVLAIMLHGCVQRSVLPMGEVKNLFGDDVATIINGLVRINQ